MREMTIKTPAELAIMARAGALNARALDAVRGAIRPGITPRELDQIAYDVITAGGGTPGFREGKPLGSSRYAFTISLAVDDQIAHIAPSIRPLEAGQIVSVDCGAFVDGFHSDAAFTTIVSGGSPSMRRIRLVSAAHAALWAGIDAALVGNRISDITGTIEGVIAGFGSFLAVRGLTGHGVGRALHEGPRVPNAGTVSNDVELREGMVLAIEPLVSAGSDLLRVDEATGELWTDDGALASHAEHTVAITRDGPMVLTASFVKEPELRQQVENWRQTLE